MEADKRDALIKYRLEQAHDTISEVELLLDHDKYRAAVSRMYYGIFYALLALANTYKFATSKHGQLIGWFNREFIKTDVFDRKYGKILRDAFKIRHQGDYDAFIEFSNDDVERRFGDMKDFICSVETHISRNTKTPDGRTNEGKSAVVK